MKNTGIKYEHLTQEIYNEILNYEGIDTIKVQHNVTLKGKTTSHQIDVYWECKIANSRFSMIIQAKDWKTAVPKKEMLAFVEIIRDLPTGTKGVFISKSGFQKGAIEVAIANGIDIYILKEAELNDFKDKMMKMKVDFCIEIPFYEDIEIEVNKNKNPIVKEGKFPISRDLIIYEKDKEKNVSEIILELCNQNNENIKKCDYKFDEGYIILEGKKIFIERLIGKFGISRVMQQINIDGFDNIGLILKDIINKELKIFDKQNKFLKDIQG